MDGWSPREVAHRAASDSEMIAWVDEQDHSLGGLPREQLRSRGLIGRGTFVLLLNGQGELCVHRRTLSKAIYPGYWDVAAGGMVLMGETYLDSAHRELEEELGVTGIDLNKHGRFFFSEPGNRLWCAVYSTVFDGPLRLQPEEVAEACFLPLEAVHEKIAREPFCPDSLQALQLYLASLP